MGRRSLKAHRRKEIIEAFYHTAAEEGIHNTSIAKIAEVMEVNPSLILHYFKNRNEMVYELVNYILDGYLQLYDVDQSQPAIDQLKDVLSNLFSREWNALISDDVYYSCYSLIFRDPTIQQKYKTLNDSLRESLAGHLEACANEGALTIKDPRQTANLVYTILDGTYYYLCMESDATEQARLLEQCREQVLNLLNMETLEKEVTG